MAWAAFSTTQDKGRSDRLERWFRTRVQVPGQTTWSSRICAPKHLFYCKGRFKDQSCASVIRWSCACTLTGLERSVFALPDSDQLDPAPPIRCGAPDSSRFWRSPPNATQTIGQQRRRHSWSLVQPIKSSRFRVPTRCIPSAVQMIRAHPDRSTSTSLCFPPDQGMEPNE